MSDPLRELERASLRDFVASCSDHLTGRVLDYGAGRSPYRDLVTGTYTAFDHPDLPGYIAGGVVAADDPLGVDAFTAILCTQVIQYVPDPGWFLRRLRWGLLVRLAGGPLILTGPTNWPVVEPQDLWRFTPNGIRRLLEDEGFTVERLVERASVPSPGGPFLLGWGAVAIPK